MEIVNLGGPTVAQQVRPLMIWDGLVFGQFLVLAVWAVFGPQRLLLRWPLTLALAELAFGGLVVGTAIATHTVHPDAWIVCLHLPLLFLSAQLLMWLVRWLVGWRIVSGESSQALPDWGYRQFRVQDLLVITAFMAVTLAMARMGGVMTNWSNFLALVVFCGMSVLASAVWALPCVAGVFLSEGKFAGMAMMFVVVIPAVSGAFSVAITLVSTAEIAKDLLVQSSVVMGVLSASLWTARLGGFPFPSPPARKAPSRRAGKRGLL